MKTTELTTVEKLTKFVNQKNNFDTRNYFDTYADKDGVQAFRQDYNLFLKQGKIYRQLLRACEDRLTGFNTKLTTKLIHSNDRLSLVGDKIQYITGQYFPTEFRGAACRVLWQLLWEDYANERENGEPVYETGHDIRKAITRRVGKSVVNFMY